MLAIAARLVAPPAQRRLGAWAIGTVLLLLVQIALGAFTSAAFAGLACTDLRECFEQAHAGAWNWAALNPWREPAFAVGTPHPEGALVQLLHRLGSFVVAPLLAWFGVCGWRRGHRFEAAALLLLLASQVALGLVIGSTGLPLVPVLLHNLGTALMLALVLRLA
jgi:heme a synthase